MKKRILIFVVVALVVVCVIAGGVYYYTSLPTAPILGNRYLDSSKVFLIDSYLSYGVFDRNITIHIKGRSAYVGDPAVIVSGKIRNDYDKDYYFAITGNLFTSKGEVLRGPDYIFDHPMGEFTVVHASAHDFGTFELHFKYEGRDIERYTLVLAMEPQENPPP